MSKKKKKIGNNFERKKFAFLREKRSPILG